MMTRRHGKAGITSRKSVPENSTTEEISHAPLERVFDEIPASLESLAKSVRLQSQACQIVWAVECSPPTVAWIDPAVQDLIVQSLSKDSQVHHSSSSSDRVGEEFEDS